MKTNRYLAIIAAIFLGLSMRANAVDILCKNPAVDHMLVSDAYVSACVAAGTGNINQNPGTDAFLVGGGTAAGYVGAGFQGTFTQTGTTGTWSLAHAVDAIGFKFGTGGNPDEWFIYLLQPGVTSGTFTFVNEFFNNGGQPIGGGLSHIETYNKTTDVPAPATLLILSLGLFGVGIASQWKKSRA